MWLMLPKGALSITVSPKEPDKLQVRARRVEWLDAFREYCPELGPNIHTTKADYQWRALGTPEDVARAVARVTLAIDYSNFKNATMDHAHGLKDPGLRHSLHSAYSSIWSVLLKAGDGSSGMQSPWLSGSIAVCARQGHWWPEGASECSDCSAPNPSYPHEGPKKVKPTKAEVRAWWAARKYVKAVSTLPASTLPVAKLPPAEGWNVCHGSGQAYVKGTLVKGGGFKGECQICGMVTAVDPTTLLLRTHADVDLAASEVM